MNAYAYNKMYIKLYLIKIGQFLKVCYFLKLNRWFRN